MPTAARTSPFRKCALLLTQFAFAFVLSLIEPATASSAEVTTRAFIGKPFGVGVVTQRRVTDQSLKDWDAPFEISDVEGRMLYPVRRVAAISNAQPNEPNFEVWDYFLFRGDEPLTLKSVDGEPIGIVITPEQDSRKQRELLDQWWKARGDRRQQLIYLNGAQPIVADFTNAMLARRLKFPPLQRPQGYFSLDAGISFLLGTESIREALQVERLLATDGALQALVNPLPEGVAIPAVPVPPIPEGVVIEPLAQHVPAECFYLRCGSYSNFVWLRKTIDQWGGSLRDILNRKSIDYSIQKRFEAQLSLRETEAAKLFGDAIVKDIAIIGFDNFLREGASFGVLIESDNSDALRAEIAIQRALTKAANSRVTEAVIDVAGHRVSFLSTPDNRVRSFLAESGDVTLVTNSQELVRRFYEASEGKDALSSLDEFRYARSQHPLTKPSAGFLHLSDNFFRNLLSPKYRVEMTRRAVADVDLENVELALLAAQAEGAKVDAVDDLYRLDYLPTASAKRSDGSHVVAQGDRFIDSARGARGFFVPVADMPIEMLTTSEVDAYAKFKEQYRRVWERVDPVTINIEKHPVAGQPRRERVVLDIRICPVAQMRYGFLSGFFDAPTKQRLAPIPGSLIDMQARIKPMPFALNHALIGVVDGETAVEIKNGRVSPTDNELANRALYFASNNPNLARDILNQRDIELDQDTNTQQAWFPWIRRTKQFTIISGVKESLDHVAGNLSFEEAERPAQLRARIGDLSRAKSFPRIRAESYLNDARISVGTTAMLNDFTQQFRLKPDAGCNTAERVLNGRVTCMLGGELKHAAARDDFARWRSSKLLLGRMSAINSVPDDYRSQLLDWWHGLDLEFTIQNRTLQVRAELELQP